MDRADRLNLWESIRWSQGKMARYRENRYNAIEQYCGAHYTDNGSKTIVPINLIGLAIDILLYKLATRNPRVLVKTPFNSLKPSASNYQLAINTLLKKIKFVKTVRRFLLDASFGVGVIKCGLNRSHKVNIGGYTHVAGQPFADVVDLDDYVVDMHAKRWDDICYEGNFYTVVKEDAIESGIYDKSKLAKYTPDERDDWLGTAQRVDELGVDGGNDPHNDEFVERIHLLDLWLPREGKVITLLADGSAEQVAEFDWELPIKGPYHKLGFRDVPGNLLPLPLVANMIDLHELANQLFIKLGNQAARQKNLLFNQGNDDDLAETVRDSEDGDVINVDNPNTLKDVSFFGLDNNIQAFFLSLKDLFSYVNGNIEVMGGLDSQAGTLGQEQILSMGSSSKVDDHNGILVDTLIDVIDSLGYYMWSDPLINIPLTRRIEGLPDYEYNFVYTQDDMAGDFLDYNMEIELYSMQPKNPTARLQLIQQISSQLIIPLLPVLQSQGININFVELFKVVAEYADLPELTSIIESAVSVESYRPGPVNPPQVSKPAATNRNYTRVSTSVPSKGGQNVMMQQMLQSMGKGGGPQKMSRVN